MKVVLAGVDGKAQLRVMDFGLGFDPETDGPTPRQREVLQLVAEGKTSKEISSIPNISSKTVEFHRNSLMDELGIRSTAELTRYAISHGIVS